MTCSGTVAIPSMPRQPNILFIMADQHAPDAIGALGHPCVQTPALDALAGRGVSFVQAYCNYPMCTPARASFMTGLLTPQHGVWELGAPLASDIPTWAHALRAAGYRTSISGRMHFVGEDQMHGFEHRACPDSLTPKRMYAYDPWMAPIADEHVMIPAVQRGGPTPEPTGNERCDQQVHRAALTELDRLSAAGRADGRPWALMVGLIQPHIPYNVSQSWYDRYDGADIPMPRTPPEGRCFEAHIPEQMRGSRRWLGLTDDGATPEQVRRSRQAYYAMVTAVDAMVGELVERLQALGEMENTWVCYGSDHGDNLGEHGMWSKLNFFEDSVRVPLIIAAPGVCQGGDRCAAPVSLIDWLPTVLDLTGRTWPTALPGRSLLPLLRGVRGMSSPGDRWSERPVIADYACGGTRVPMRMVRRGRWKTCFAPPLPPVLFDLERDPHEWTDLGADPAWRSVIDELESAARAGGWEPQAMLEQIRQQKRVLHFLASMSETAS